MAHSADIVLERSANISRHRPSAQSSICIWSFGGSVEEDASFANDGVFDRAEPDRDYGCHTDHEKNPWWQVDLGQPMAVDRVVVYNRRTWLERMQFFSILFSEDGRTWHHVYRKASPDLFGDEGDGSWTAEVETPHLARYVRIRLDGSDHLAIRQCEVFGRRPAAAEIAASAEAAAEAAREAELFVAGRKGEVVSLANFEVFADAERYSSAILGAFGRNDYEGRERDILRRVLRPTDRVLEVGTAVGVISMTAAATVGAEAVATYEANPYIHEDAKRNFRRNGMRAIRARHAVLRNRKQFVPGETVRFYISKDFWSSRMDVSVNDDDIVEIVEVPTLCLEDEIAAHKANFLICDIEGGEIDLLLDADLSGLDTILIETHYWAVGKAATSALLRKLVTDGFDIDLDQTGAHVSFLRRGLGREVR